MRLLNLNKPEFGKWLQIPHPVLDTFEIIYWIDRGPLKDTMYAVIRSPKNYSYSQIPKSYVCSY